MEELRTPAVLMDEHMGHIDGTVQGRYSHVTRAMVEELLVGLQRLWEEALEARRRLCPCSAVKALDRLLRASV